MEHQTGTFTEATYSNHGERSEWIGGINFVTDHFNEEQLTQHQSRDYEQITTGIFIQNNLKQLKSSASKQVCVAIM
jgi:iron complex outermembrane receptor protein